MSMLDDFRQQAGSSFFIDEDEIPSLEEAPEQVRRHFLGMTPVQRFVVAVMLLLLTCLLSAFCLLVTERIVLPFL